MQKEQGDAVESFAFSGNVVTRVKSLATPKMVYVEPAQQNEATFTVTTPKELARVNIPSVTGRATLGDHVAQTLSSHAIEMQQGPATLAAAKLIDSVAHVQRHVRDLGAVKLSLHYLAGRPIGELNVAFRTTLDAFSYRLDAWLTARATRRLEQIRAANPTGVYVGGYAWLENLKADAAAGQRGLPPRTFARAGSDRIDPAQRLHGQSRAGRVQHHARLEAYAARRGHPPGTHA